MSPSDEQAIAKFKQTECFQRVKERLAMFFLRGQDVDSEYLRETGILNKVYQAQSVIQVVNILGYVLNKPMAEFEDLAVEEVERRLRTGDFCFIKDDARKELENVVKKMKTFQFELLPLVVVFGGKKSGESFETLLIKVYKNGWPYSRVVEYVDISGRIYESFPQFLEKNKLPVSILCHPKNGEIRFSQDTNELEVDCCPVGVKNAIHGMADIVLGVVGAAGTVGSIFATGGLVMPFMAVACGSALYATGRGVEKLVDAKRHGMSLNPFEDAEARNNWLMVSANLLTFASIGASVTLAAKLESVTATTAGRLLLANRVLRGVSAGVNAVTVVDSFVYGVNNWRRLTIYEKISLACAVCFCFREVISFVNAERLIRASQVDGICRFLRTCSDTAGGVAVSTQSFVTNVKRMFEDNDEYLATGLKLVRTLLQDQFSVTVNDDCTVIRLFGFEYEMRNIISMPEAQLGKFLYMIQGIAQSFKDAFSLLRRNFGDERIASAVFKRADELGGNRADYGRAINELLEVFTLVKRMINDVTILTEGRLNIGSDNEFTIGSAYKVFVVQTGPIKSVSLIKALVDLNPREATRLNALRSSWGSKEPKLFEWITTNSVGSDAMLEKMRFLLQVNEICTEKSLRITDLNPSAGNVEIESLIRVSPQVFFQSAHPSYLIDPKFLRTCEPAMCCHSETLQTLWQNACLSPQPMDKAWEKLNALQTAFQSFPFSVENVVAYALSTQPRSQDFSQFFYHCLFALNNLEKQKRENGGNEPAANEALFTDQSALRSKFNELIRKVEELQLAGYHPIDESSLQNPIHLLELIKSLARSEQLRFGPPENAALHLDALPMLRIAGTKEIGKYNRFIAMKRFDREEVQPVDESGSKWMIYLANEQLQIVVGVVRRQGAYLDTISFTQAN